MILRERNKVSPLLRAGSKPCSPMGRSLKLNFIFEKKFWTVETQADPTSLGRSSRGKVLPSLVNN